MFKKFTIFAFVFIAATSLFFQFYKHNQVPYCLHDDEAAQGYTAYSLLKTGHDEHGAFLPLRFKSYGDYKLPLYTYLTIPFVATLGTTETAARAVNTTAVLIIPLVMFLIVREITKDRAIAIISTFLIASSVWIHILSRQAHEGTLAALFILLSFLFILKYSKSFSLRDFLLGNWFIFLSTLSYHFGRIFVIFVVLWQIYIFIKQKKLGKTTIQAIATKTLLLLGITASPFAIDAISGSNRTQFLFFPNNPGFVMRIGQYLNEHPIRLIHNKLFEFIREASYRYTLQFSPEFFLHGVDDFRYSMPYLSFITLTEYIFIFVGLYFLFKKRERFRFLVLFSFLISAVPNALTFQTYALGRNYMMIFPIVFIVAYGVRSTLSIIRNKNHKILVSFLIASSFIFYLVNSWDIYFNHYPKHPVVLRVWQCGRKEAVNYIKENYNNFDQFVITNKHGQAYMFLLYYLKYDPAKYQKRNGNYYAYADKFLTVSNFDKYKFKFEYDPKKKGVSYIGYPDDFGGFPIDEKRVKKIKFGIDDIFWIYENPR